jgi:hypothetical protein
MDDEMTKICGDTTTCDEAAAFQDENFGAMTVCLATTITGQTINNDYYNSASSSSSTSKSGGGCFLWNCGSGSSSSSSSSYSYANSSYDATSMVLQTFNNDPAKDPNAVYCAEIKITNTDSDSSSYSSQSNSSSNSSSGRGGLWPFIGGRGSRSGSSRSSSSNGSDNSTSAYDAKISFAWTADYDKYISTVESETIDDEIKSIIPQAKADNSDNLMESKTAAKINDVIKSIYESPKLSMCLFGRDISQASIKSEEQKTTEARFPRLFDNYARIIIASGKRQANINYQDSMKKVKDDLKSRALANIKSAMNTAEYSEDEEKAVTEMIEGSLKAL